MATNIQPQNKKLADMAQKVSEFAAEQAKQQTLLTKGYKEFTETLKTEINIRREINKLLKDSNIQVNEYSDTLDITKSVNDDILRGQERLNRLTTNFNITHGKLKELLKAQLENQRNGLKVEESLVKKLAEANKERDLQKDNKLFKDNLQVQQDYNNKVKEASIALSQHRKQLHDVPLQIKDATEKLKKYQNEFSREEPLQIKRKAIEEVGKNLTSTIEGLKDKPLTKALGLDKFITNMSFAHKLALETFVYLVKQGFEIFKQYDKAAFDLRKNLGLMRGDFDRFNRILKDTVKETLDLGVNFDDVVKSITEISKQFTFLVATDKTLVKDVSLLSKQLGISEATSVSFLKTMSQISGKTIKEARVGMIGFTKELTNAAGVPLNDVMEDIAKASDEIRGLWSKNTTQFIKAAVEARKMGTTIEAMAKSSRFLLDFQSSISSEMEASVLLGRNLNLQEARRLSFLGNVEGANKEILKQVKRMGDFDKLNVFQKEAIAKSTGKSIVDIQNQLQMEKQMDEIRNGTDQQLKDQLAKYEKLRSLNEDNARFSGKNAENMLRQKANQERIVQLQNQWNKFIMEITGPVVEILDPLLKLATSVFPVLLKGARALLLGIGTMASVVGILYKGFSGLSSLTAKIGLTFLSLSKYLLPVSTTFKLISNTVGSVFGVFGKLVSKISSFGGIIGKFGGFLGTFGKFLGPVGIVISLFELGANILKRWEQFPHNLSGGLKAVGMAIVDTLISPFKAAWEIIKPWMGQSPSELGLGILKGIVSIGGMLFDAITAPFRKAFNYVSGLFGGPTIPAPSSLISNLSGNPQANKTSTNTTKPAAGPSNDDLIVQKLDELISLMRNGGISVNLDGKKVSRELSYIGE